MTPSAPRRPRPGWPRPTPPSRRGKPSTSPTRPPSRWSAPPGSRCPAARRDARRPPPGYAAPRRIAERLGARPLADQIAALLPPGTARRPAPATGTEPERLGLTGRELEVLRLVAAGQSNREIAAALFISPKTASVHVSNILAKLGAATRTEAAARAHALRLFDAQAASR